MIYYTKKFKKQKNKSLKIKCQWLCIINKRETGLHYHAPFANDHCNVDGQYKSKVSLPKS